MLDHRRAGLADRVRGVLFADTDSDHHAVTSKPAPVLERVKIEKRRDHLGARFGALLLVLCALVLGIDSLNWALGNGGTLLLLYPLTLPIILAWKVWTQTWKQTRIALLDGGLAWTAGRNVTIHIPTRAIEAALLVGPHKAVLRTAGWSYQLTVEGDEVGVFAPTDRSEDERAPSLLTLLAHVGAGTRDTFVPLRTASGAAFLAGVGALVTFVATICLAFAAGANFYAAPVILLTTAATFFLLARLGRSSMTLSKEGIVLLEGRRRTLVPYRSLRAVTVSGTVMNATPQQSAADTHVALLLQGLDGRERRVATTGNRAFVEALGRRIARAIEMHKRTDTRAHPGDQLARGRRTVAEWRAQLEGARDAFRTPSIPTEQLVDVLEDPYAPADQRVGAALVLRRHARIAHGAEMRDTAVAARIRVAATSATEPALRAAFELATEDEVDDERLGAALARAARG